MARYRVQLARTHWFSMDVEAGDEEQAYELAYDASPGLSANESGWGEKWGVDADDRMSLEDFFGAEYDPKEHGQTVQLLDEAQEPQ